MTTTPTKISDFNVGQMVHGNFLVLSIQRAETVNNKPYLDIELGDKTGKILGKLWDITFQAEQVKVGDIVYATGRVTEWQGSNQFKLDYIETSKEKLNVTDFIISAPLTTAFMNDYIEKIIEGMSDTELQIVTGHLYEEHRERFLEAPAARGMHHAIYSGLAYHTVTMLQTAEKLLDVYTFLNRDLLYAGIILHDLAKIDEMIYSLGAVSDYSRGGYLLGHIVQGTMMIERAATKLMIDVRTKEILQHMVVSHHEKGEWGSPQPPRVPEAVLLHFIDNIDAKMFMVKELIDGKRTGEYTEKHRGLGQKLVIY